MHTVDLEDVARGKRILRALVVQRVSVAEWMKNRVDYLLRCDMMFKDEIYLQIALTQTYAYMEMGFCYQDNQECFDELLRRLGTCRELEFPRMIFPSERIPLNKSRLRSAIGKWIPPRDQRLTGPELYADMIKKVSDCEEGYYEYTSGAVKKNQSNAGRLELFVGARDSYLYNVDRDIYYLFDIKKDGTDR